MSFFSRRLGLTIFTPCLKFFWPYCDEKTKLYRAILKTEYLILPKDVFLKHLNVFSHFWSTDYICYLNDGNEILRYIALWAT